MCNVEMYLWQFSVFVFFPDLKTYEKTHQRILTYSVLPSESNQTSSTYQLLLHLFPCQN